jgi:predicted adenine nucleotide alpha hydrolase (AANH) superfamily ATPase
MQQINDNGHRSAMHYPSIMYWDYNWRKQMSDSKQEAFF